MASFCMTNAGFGSRRNLLLSTSIAALSLAMTAPGMAQSLPTGGAVVSGTATISSPNGSSLNVQQSSETAILSWQGFSVGHAASAHFENGSGATLNRVLGNVPSTIDGALSATGSLYLINPAGVTVGLGGSVATGGSFVASTHDVTNDDFLDGGSLTFAGTSGAEVINAGTIRSAQGDVALIARRVENAGTIHAPEGTAALAAGYRILMLDHAGAAGKFAVEIGGDDTEAVTSGTIAAAEAEIRANGGNVYALAGNTDAVVRATGMRKSGGRVFLTAGPSGSVSVGQRVVARRPSPAKIDAPKAFTGGDIRVAGGDVTISGTLDVSGFGDDGGTVVVTGPDVRLTQTASLDASGLTGGTLLVGGDLRGGANPFEKILGEDIATADVLSVAAGAVLTADGAQGDGGDVVLWSDSLTTFAGAISATGGGAGNGGFAEVSGKRRLAFTGTVDLTAQGGQTGSLLLDPYNVTISDAVDQTSAGFTATGDDSVINVATLEVALAGANVTVSTGAGGTQAGDITVADSVAWSANTLTLDAAGSIVVDAQMTATAKRDLPLLTTRRMRGAIMSSTPLSIWPPPGPFPRRMAAQGPRSTTPS